MLDNHRVVSSRPSLRLQAGFGPLALSDIVTGLAASAPVWCRDLPSHPTRRTGLRLLATDDYDVWLLRWPPGTSVTPHDHGGSSGAFVLVSGELTEVRWSGALPRKRLVAAAQVVTIEEAVVHDVVAEGAEAALSVHAYSPPLTSMGFYDSTGCHLVDRQPVSGASVAVASGPVLHPSRER